MSISQSPSLGRTHTSYVEERLAASAEYRRVHAELAAFERLARVVIMRRSELGLSQRELAERMGTSGSVISRIESGQHATSIRTLTRLASALEAEAIVGFRFSGDNDVDRADALVAL
jgi:ribosome-binding protein aMBF1 (putative translation factor)